MKIAVYAICQNEEKFVASFLAAHREADRIIILDTGSTDKSIELLAMAEESFRSKLITGVLHKPFRFDVARNEALALVPDDIDVCVQRDLDERMVPGWRDKLESVFMDDETTRLVHLFETNGKVAPKDTIHRRHGYHWELACHEVLVADDPLKDNLARIDEVLFTHHPDLSKPRANRIELMELACKERPNDPRLLRLLGEELIRIGKAQEARHAYVNSLIYEVYPPYRAFAAQRIAQICFADKKPLKMLTWAEKGVRWFSMQREPWLCLAQAQYICGYPKSALKSILEALRIKGRAPISTTNDECWDDTPVRLYHRICGELKIKPKPVENKWHWITIEQSCKPSELYRR